MMRSIIIGLSVVFFSLTAIVTFKALKLPVYATAYQDYPSEIMPMPTPPVSAPAPMPESTPNTFSYTTEDPDSNKALAVGEEKHLPSLKTNLQQLKVLLKTIKLSTLNISRKP